MTVRLIIARHGNTFSPDEVPYRIGAKTDLPLSDSGREQSERLGKHFAENGFFPDIVYTSQLKRTFETAEIALNAAGIQRSLHKSDMFDEIDHGPDEGKMEPDIVARIGAKAYNAWEFDNVVPPDWTPSADVIRKRWADFAKHCEDNYDGKTVLVVTSNGIARFSSFLANNAGDIVTQENRKIGTGRFCVLEGDGGLWMISHWNVRPE